MAVQKDEHETTHAAARAAEAAGDAAEKATRSVTQAGTDIARRGWQTMRDGQARFGRDAAARADDLTRSVAAAAAVYGEAAQAAAEDVQTLLSVSATTASALPDLQRAWVEWLNHAARTSTQASQDLARCSTLLDLAEVQRRLVRESLHGFLEGSARMLRISSRLAEEALRPIERRLDAAEGEAEESRGRDGSARRAGRGRVSVEARH
jgi:hypothetical protein